MRWFSLALLSGLLLGSVASAQAPAKPMLVFDAGGHTGRIWDVLVTPDRRELITISYDKTIRIWDVDSGQSVRTLRPPIGPDKQGLLIGAALSPDGRMLAAGGIGVAESPNAIYLISLASGQIARVLTGHTQKVHTLAFAPDGKTLASAAADGTARVWDVQDGTCLHVLKGHTHPAVNSVAYAPNGETVLTACMDKTARIWSAKTGEVQRVLKHEGQLSWATYAPDSLTIATCAGWSVCRWDTDGKYLGETNTKAALTFAKYTPDGKEIFFTGHKGAGFVQVAADTVRWLTRDEMTGGNLAPDGSLAATANTSGEIMLWSPDGTLVRRLHGKSKAVWSAAWSADGKTIAFGTQGSRPEKPNTEFPLTAAFSLTELEWERVPATGLQRQRLTSADGQTLELHDLTTVQVVEGGQPPRKLTRPEAKNLFDQVTSFTYWTEKLVAVGVTGLSLFDPATGQHLRTFDGHVGEVWALAPSPDHRYLLSASNDHTLRIWKPTQDQPLLSLLFAGTDWIAWTPEGYYACSPGGENLVGWHVNNGPAKLATYHTAAQFRHSLYRPDVIKRVLAAGSTAKALELADVERVKKSQLTKVAEVLPPLVVVTSPDQRSVEVPEPSVEVRFLAKPVGNHPITAVRLLIDGRPYPGTECVTTFDPPQTNEVRQSWTVKLANGKHRLAVQAETSVSKAVSEAVEVSYYGRGVERVPKDPEAKKQLLPNLYMLAVGVSAYPEKLKLNYAAKDATVLAKTCQEKSQRLFKEVTVKLLTDKDATRKNILQGLTWLRKQMTQNDVAIIFFAGHGAKDSDGSFYLLPVDVDTDDLLSTGVPGDQLKKTLAGMPGKFLVMLDACHAGAVDGEKRRAASALTDDLVRDLATDDYGVVVMCSSMGREFSLESPTVEHGYFTLAMVEGLSGKADYNQDSVVHLNELDLYVTNRVKELSEGRQHPVTARPTSIRSFPLTHLIKP